MNKEFDLDDGVSEAETKFPEADFRFLVLDNYINEISEILRVTYDQKLLRLRARISNEKNQYTKCELEGEVLELEEMGIEKLSHIIWGGVMTSIFATFESSIQDIFEFCSQEIGVSKFDKKNYPKKSFVQAANKYSKIFLGIGLYSSKQEKTLLTDLSQLRNSYVHNGCKIDSLNNKLKVVIQEGKYGRYALVEENGIWLANAENTKLYRDFASRCYFTYRHNIFRVLFANPLAKE